MNEATTALSVESKEQSFGMTTILTNKDMFDSMLKIANMMATAKTTVPKHFQGSQGDCMAVVMQASQWKMNPFAVAQKTHLVNGTLGYEAQLVNAVITTSGAITGTFKYEYKGEGANLECRVGAVIKGETEITWGEWLHIGLITVKNSPLWKTNPKQQMGYLQVKNWARMYAPAAILGVYTSDELEEPTIKDITPQATATVHDNEPKPYPQADYEKNKATWKKAVESGKKTPNALIATIETKGYLTNEQKLEIASWQPIEAAYTVQTEAKGESVDMTTGEIQDGQGQ